MARVDSDSSPSPLLPWALPLLRLSLCSGTPAQGMVRASACVCGAGWALDMGPGDTRWTLMQALPCLEGCPHLSSPEGPQKTFEIDA